MTTLREKSMGATTILICFVTLIFVSLSDSRENYYASARIESCSGCALNRLPDVKRFIFDDVPLYKNVEFKHIQGAMPELVLFNENDEAVERLPLQQLTREECNELLASKGFVKEAPKDEI